MELTVELAARLVAIASALLLLAFGLAILAVERLSRRSTPDVSGGVAAVSGQRTGLLSPLMALCWLALLPASVAPCCFQGPRFARSASAG
jgi:hypothetical protein